MFSEFSGLGAPSTVLAAATGDRDTGSSVTFTFGVEVAGSNR